jgi:hypothetical protein
MKLTKKRWNTMTQLNWELANIFYRLWRFQLDLGRLDISICLDFLDFPVVNIPLSPCITIPLSKAKTKSQTIQILLVGEGITIRLRA